MEAVKLQNLFNPIISYTSSDIFERKNESKIYYKNKNVISKKFDYLKNDKYITPFLKEEKILLNSSTNNFSGTLNRRYLYSYEGAYENAPKYKNIYGYEEDTTVSGENVAQVYKREYEYTEGSNFIKKEIIKKASISNGEFIQTNKWQVDYAYNNNNCLTSVKTTYNDSSITTNSFTYSSSFPHLLTYNNSNSFVYDGLYLKQIKNYMGQVIKQFNYRGTKITSIQEPLQNKSVLFEYDYQGRRIKKLNQTINNLVEYYYDENILIREKHSNYSLNFLYNENNELIGFEHISSNNSAKTKYFYLRNAFNDIVEILDINGNSLVHYLYDAYGNTIEIIDNSSNSLATINPFRYKGYYYDVETGYFRLSSKYYSPELGRFIQPTDVSTFNLLNINGLNLYSYANNNPIGFMYSSPGFSGGAGGELVSLIASSVGGLNSVYHGAISNSSKWHFDPNFLTEAFGYIENGFSIIEGVLTAYRNFKHLPQLESLRKISKKLMIGGITLGLVVDAHNNFSNEQLSPKEQGIGFAVDGLYTVGSAALSYGISYLVTAVLASIPGVGLFALLGGVLVSIGVIELIDWTVEEYGWLDSIKDWIESW